MIENLKCSQKCQKKRLKNPPEILSLEPLQEIKTINSSGYGPFQYKSKEEEMLTLAMDYVKEFWSDFTVKFNSQSTNTVPEIYHYINFGCSIFDIPKFLSVYSVWKYSSSNAKIVYHTDCQTLESQIRFVELLNIVGDDFILQCIELEDCKAINATNRVKRSRFMVSRPFFNFILYAPTC